MSSTGMGNGSVGFRGATTISPMRMVNTWALSCTEKRQDCIEFWIIHIVDIRVIRSIQGTRDILDIPGMQGLTFCLLALKM